MHRLVEDWGYYHSLPQGATLRLDFDVLGSTVQRVAWPGSWSCGGRFGRACRPSVTLVFQSATARLFFFLPPMACFSSPNTNQKCCFLQSRGENRQRDRDKIDDDVIGTKVNGLTLIIFILLTNIYCFSESEPLKHTDPDFFFFFIYLFSIFFNTMASLVRSSRHPHVIHRPPAPSC